MTAAATLLALIIGVPFGYFLYRNTRYGVAYEGWLAAAFAAPTVLLYPLFLVIFGRSHATLIAMGFIPGAIPIIIQTRQGLLGVSKTLLNVGRSFNVSERDMFWKIQLPSAVPHNFHRHPDRRDVHASEYRRDRIPDRFRWTGTNCLGNVFPV